ncbi:aldehyde dehydrogenase family protein [Mycobacterium sp. 3519A]|uniref:aldehyde dehydrogenase family protein n=1 Tax=Mycobacterium sp. 3519A TaxID=2057184 RepID=UPI001F444F81|nr:aldehyde dehydrogenase family protein [Mycobacterium sp. 3519A]
MAEVSMPVRVKEFLEQEQQLYIGGGFTDCSGDVRVPVLDPASGEQITTVAEATATDIDAAVDAARKAFESPEWRQMSPSERGRIIWKLADLIEEHAEEFAFLDSLDNGKPISLTRTADVPLSVDLFRYMAGWATKIEGNTIDHGVPYAPTSKFFTYTRKVPVGVVAQIIPWNYPLMMAAYKLAPAFAAGCTVVLKPAEQTPLSVLYLADLVREAGFPSGVYNVVTGYGESVGDYLSRHPGIDKVAFTGSTEVGRLIVHNAAESLKRVSLELGGKSPNIIFDDADLDVAIPKAAQAIFFNQGQACCAGSRLFVHRSVLDEVVEGISKLAAAMPMGRGQDDEVELGPLISREQVDRVSQFVATAKTDGGMVTGGDLVEPGYFMRPAVITDLPNTSKAVQDEIFGPVVAVIPFDTEEEVIREANNTSYGLAAAIWTRDVSRAHRVSDALDAGTVWVNTYHIYDAALPFGGFKQSGWGREMGHEVFNSYTETKTVCIELHPR